MICSHYVLAFLDSGASHYLILGRSSALHYILVFMDTSRETSTSSGVVFAYIIREIVPLHEECQYRTAFQNQDFWQFL